MNTLPRRTERVKPVGGSVRWLRPLIAGKTLGRIRITNAEGKGTEYDLDAFTDAAGRIIGYGLAKDDDDIHAIDVVASTGWTCDCPDCQFRNRECKHIKALRAALAEAGLGADVPVTPPAPSREPGEDDEETVEITEQPPQPNYTDLGDL